LFSHAFDESSNKQGRGKRGVVERWMESGERRGMDIKLIGKKNR
jgi:hypothetical protein